MSASRRRRRSIPGTPCFFNGTLTPEIRCRIREKRQALGTSVQRLAKVMGICISTLYKWEDGRIGVCQPAHVRLIASFLCGHYDRLLTRAQRGRGQVPPWASMPADITRRLERAMTIYRICSSHPDLQAGFMDGLDGLMGDALQEALARSRPARQEAASPSRPEDEKNHEEAGHGEG